MIQRIQSVYLFLTALLMGLMLVFPLGRFIIGESEFSIMQFGLKDTAEGYSVILPYMGILGVASTLLPLVTIFLYKKRFLQIRLCVVELILLFGMQVLAVYYLWNTSSTVDHMAGFTISYSVVDVFPLAGLILVWLAMRAIGKDEALIRSTNRIR